MIVKENLIRRLCCACVLMVSVQYAAAEGQESEKLAAITALGSLNGIALHCNGLAETQRIKRELVANLPKRRQLGELFDYETNKSFMAFMEKDGVCPSPQDLTQQVDAALDRLEWLYRKP